MHAPRHPKAGSLSGALLLFSLLVPLVNRAGAAEARSSRPVQAGSAAAVGTAAVDAKRDPRLQRRVFLQAEGVPLAQVLDRLGAQSGISLQVVGRPSGERLLAFAADTPVSEVMLAIADLYRLTWTRESRGSGPVYRLQKEPGAVAQETELRRRCLLAILDRVQNPRAREVKRPRDVLTNPHSAAILHALREMNPVEWQRLLDGDSLSIPLTSLPEGHRDRIVETMGPVLRLLDDEVNAAFAKIREKLVAEGKPVHPSYLRIQETPPPRAEDYHIQVELRRKRLPELWVQMRRGTGGGAYTPVILRSEDALPGAAESLYADRKIRRTPGGGEAEPPGDGVFGKPVPASPAGGELKRGWTPTLARLADLTGLSFYSDDYPAEEEHRRGIAIPTHLPFTLARVLDSFANPDTYTTAGFWWRRGDSVLFRSRSWFWQSEAVRPAPALTGLSRKIQAQHRLDAEDLALLASLSLSEVQSLSDRPGQLDAWRYAIQIPGRFAPATRQRYARRGALKWADLTPADRALLASLLPPDQGSLQSYSVLFTRVGAPPKEGVHLLLNAAWGSQTHIGEFRLPITEEDPNLILMDANEARKRREALPPSSPGLFESLQAR